MVTRRLKFVSIHREVETKVLVTEEVQVSGAAVAAEVAVDSIAIEVEAAETAVAEEAAGAAKESAEVEALL